MSLSKGDLADIRKIVVEGAMEAINAVVIPRLDEHDRRFDKIEQHLAEHDKRFDEHDRRFDKIEQHLTEHDRRFDEVDRRLGNIETSLKNLEDRVEALENDIKELYTMTPDSSPSHDAKLTPEQRLRRLYADMQVLARELNVEL